METKIKIPENQMKEKEIKMHIYMCVYVLSKRDRSKSPALANVVVNSHAPRSRRPSCWNVVMAPVLLGKKETNAL